MSNLITAPIADDEQRLAIGLQLMIESYCQQIKIIGLANSADFHGCTKKQIIRQGDLMPYSITKY